VLTAAALADVVGVQGAIDGDVVNGKGRLAELLERELPCINPLIAARSLARDLFMPAMI
jgi:hypothetical protein